MNDAPSLPARLPDARWRHHAGLSHIVDILGKDEARFVGGAVRDTLIGLDVKDVDIATVHRPDAVLERLKGAGIKAVPTGIEHGTITAIVDGWPIEITTLRRDVHTDGRRATVSFADSWQEDAARRDFTINALYADPVTGEIFDYFGGLADLRAQKVRFIGSATERIAEDHLRILRYFRFLARFGAADPQDADYQACVDQSNSLMALSRERIADELLKLLGTADPLESVRLMIAGGIFTPVLPEIDAAGLVRLTLILARENEAGIAPSALRRLIALLPPDAATGEGVAKRLKLSNKARKRIAMVLGPAPAGPTAAAALAYHLGAEAATDRILLDETLPASAAARLQHWERPELSVSGGTLIARGLPPGPGIAKALHQIEDQWIDEGFPDESRVMAITDQIVTACLRAAQNL